MPVVCSRLPGKGKQDTVLLLQKYKRRARKPGPHLPWGRQQSPISNLPSQASISQGIIQMTSDLKLSEAGRSDGNSRKAVGSGTRVAAWPCFPQRPTLPWVCRHLLTLRHLGHFTIHLFKVFETLWTEQLRLYY